MVTAEGLQGAEEHLTGVIDRVTFHSEETGFAVLKVVVRGHREPVAVVGTAGVVREGEWLDAVGRWTIDPRHGQQFRAATIRTAAPSTGEGVQRYLASGAIRGVRELLAAALVEKFGADVLRVIDEQPERLREVHGIGPKRAAMIVESWREQKAVREIMVFLHSHGVTATRAFRIFKTYGERAIEKVQADPYCLARDIRGIGFVTADRIAASLGVDRHSELRARAGLEWVLGELTDEGHCAYPQDQLLERATAMLEIPAEVVAGALEHTIAERRVVRRQRTDGEPLVYLAFLDRAERAVAEALAALSRAPHPCPPIDLDKAIAWAEGQIGITLAAAQREALALAVAAKVLVITGGPGVGKTTLVNAIVKVMAAKKLRVLLAAPTGRAAKRMAEATQWEAKTIHRLLEVDGLSGTFRRNADTPLEADVVIIDETSMIDLPLAYHLLRAVPRGAALILVGDVDQLPSVGPGCVLADVIASRAVAVCRLTEIFRQAAASAIVTGAHRVNQGLLPHYPRSKQEGEGSDFFLVEAEEPPRGVELILKLVRESIPQRFGLDPLDDIQVLTPMLRGELGARNLNQVLQAALNPQGQSVQRFGFTFRVGDRVMQTENDYDKDVFNGDIGRIAAIDTADGSLAVRFDDRLIAYRFEELDELAHAYAITVHKSQGSEYPAVIVPVHTQHYVMLERNLIYTAITRGKRLVVLVGTPQALAIAVKRVRARVRVTTLQERLKATARGDTSP